MLQNNKLDLGLEWKMCEGKVTEQACDWQKKEESEE